MRRLEMNRPSAGWVLWLAVAAGLALRVSGMENQSLWLDEMTSMQVALEPLSNIIGGGAFDNHTPPLYYALLHFWLKVFPADEFWLRLPSALVDIANIFLLSALCRRFLAPRNTALVAAAYALSPFMIYYSQEGRMYTLAVFFALSFSLSFERLLRSEKRIALWTVATGVLLAMGVYTHYYLAFFAAGAYILGMVHGRGSFRKIGALVSSGAISVVLFLPWAFNALRLAGSGGQAFRKFLFTVPPYAAFRFFAGYAVFPINMHTKENFLSEAFSNLHYILAVFAVVLFLAYRSVASSGRRLPVLAAAAWVAAAPALIGLLVSLKTPMLSERYLIIVLPFVLVCLLGFIDISRKTELAGVALLFAVMLAGDLAYFLNPYFGKAQWRDAAVYVSEKAGQRDLVLVEPGYASAVFGYYFDKDGILRPEEGGRIAESARTGEPPMDLMGGKIFLVSSGPLPYEGRVAKALSAIAVKKEARTFELETGITCTTWEVTDLRARLK